MKKNRRILQGFVVSDKSEKTVIVSVERNKRHPLYRKNVKFHKKIKAHDEKETAHTGDLVKIIESRPYSKDKKFRLLEIVEAKK
jgi:small subunit ribosomal protein S17